MLFNNKLYSLIIFIIFSGFVEPKLVEDYSGNRLKFVGKGKGASFHDAVQKMDEYISNPMVCVYESVTFLNQQMPQTKLFFTFYLFQKYKSNAHVNPTKVLIKTERQIEEGLGIKSEFPNSNESNLRTFNKKTAASWGHEKEGLISKIGGLKSENQQYILDLKKSQESLKHATLANQELELKVKRNEEKHLNELRTLQTELSVLNAAVEKEKIDNEKHVAELKREINLSQAQFKQLQKAMSDQNTAVDSNNEHDSDDTDQDFFEVDQLIGDKLVQKRVYRVRWKGFDSTHDSWVDEDSLNCPSILKKYLKSKKLM